MRAISHSAKQKRKRLIQDIIFIIILIAFDQFTKYLAVLQLKDKSAFKIIDGVLELNYLENKGAAFGMLQNQGGFFVFVAVIVLGVIAYILYKTPNAKKYTLMHILLSLIAAGAIGNMIDRIRLDYVVDFIYIILINFPIFNVADCYVTVSAILLVFLVTWRYDEGDLAVFSWKKGESL